jgi:hypothetical protein
MNMRNLENQVSFKSYSSVIFPSGSFLTFPQLHSVTNDSKDATRQQQGEVHSLMIKLSTQRKRLEGAIVGNTLVVVTSAALFRRLDTRLRKRQLKENPITFSFKLNEKRALCQLLVDGKDWFE